MSGRRDSNLRQLACPFSMVDLSGIPESNWHLHLGKVTYYHYTNPALLQSMSVSKYSIHPAKRGKLSYSTAIYLGIFIVLSAKTKGFPLGSLPSLLALEIKGHFDPSPYIFSAIIKSVSP